MVAQYTHNNGNDNETHHVENMQQFVLLTAVEAVHYDNQSSVVIGECIHTSGEVTDGLHLLLKQLHQSVNLQSVCPPSYVLNLLKYY